MSNAKDEPLSFEDIPIAEREISPAAPPIQPKSNKIWLWLSGLAAIALLSGGAWAAYQAWQTRSSANPAPVAASSPVPSVSSDGRLLNHFPYAEAPQAELAAITADGGMKLRTPAAEAFKNMVAAASADGVILNPLSAFRSHGEQQSVYFDVKAERAQSLEQRAQVSAPPGYSEHHTGYAIDIGDGNVPAVNLSPNFEQTEAFKWLAEHAVKFNFEMSFPRDNKQGVTYEPWHWRFVGDKQSLETFYKAKEFQKQP